MYSDKLRAFLRLTKVLVIRLLGHPRAVARCILAAALALATTAKEAGHRHATLALSRVVFQDV